MKPRGLFSLCLIHFFIDAYGSIFGPLAALARLEPARTGFLGTLFAAATSFSQLPFGYLSDRLSLRFFVTGGFALATLSLSVCGLLVHSPALLGMGLLLGGLGIAAFHPGGVVLAARSVPERPAVGVSVFITVGMFGIATGPFAYVLFARAYGLERSHWLILPGLVLLPLAAWFPRLSQRHHAGAAPVSRRAALRDFLSSCGPALLPIYVLVVVRSAVQISLTQFVPTLMVGWGHSDLVAGFASTVYMAGAALGMLVWGLLAARHDRRWLQVVSVVAGAPATLLFLAGAKLPLSVSLTLLGASGFFLLSTNTMHILMGQELSPRHASTISSLVMGVGWGVGAFAPVIVGWLSGTLGLEGALAIICSAPILTLPLTGFLRGRPLARQPPAASRQPPTSPG